MPLPAYLLVSGKRPKISYTLTANGSCKVLYGTLGLHMEPFTKRSGSSKLRIIAAMSSCRLSLSNYIFALS